MIVAASLRARAIACAGAFAFLCSCATRPENATEPTPAPTATQEAPGAPQFAGAPPAKMLLDGKPLDVDPSGAARYLVRARFVDAEGRPTDLVSGGDVEFVPSRGTAQWQTRLRFGGPAAVVSTFEDGPLTVTVHADVGPKVPNATIGTNTKDWSVPRVVARALGPHRVWIGWFPREVSDVVNVTRVDNADDTIAAAAPSSSAIDAGVQPGHTYAYHVAFAGRGSATVSATTPAEFRHGTIAQLGGKGAWLSFSPSTLDADGYDKLDPGAVVARARAAGLRSVYLRTTYGPFHEITPEDSATIDAVIDALAAAHIATIAWTVPRSLRFEDYAAEVDAARYRTPGGHGFAALAVDLERGGYFLGSGTSGYRALAHYLESLRDALGPAYPIIATVEDPNLEHLTDANYPFAAIAKQADVLQPMVYWRLASRTMLSPKDVARAVAASQAAVLGEAQSTLPVNLGFQSSAEGPHGAPAPAEIASAVAQAKKLDVLGVTFFDWGGTPDATWRAIGNARW